MNNYVDLIKVIDELYPTKNLDYLQLYGTDLFITVIIIFVFVLLVIYFSIINKFPEIKKNWAENKCKPLYIPLSGFILNDPNKSKYEVVQETFSGCITSIVTSIIQTALQPVYYAMTVATSALADILKAINSIRTIFSRTRGDITNISESISGKLLNFTIPVTKFIIDIKDFMAKGTGILVTAFFIAVDSFLTIKSAMQTIFLIILDYIITPTAATTLALFTTRYALTAGIVAASTAISEAVGPQAIALIPALTATITALTITKIAVTATLIPILTLLLALLAVYIPLNVVVSEALKIPPVVIPNYM